MIKIIKKPSTIIHKIEQNIIDIILLQILIQDLN